MVLVLMLLLQLLLFRPTVLAAKSRCCRATAADGRRNLVETILKDLVEVEGVLAPRPAAAGLHHRDDGPGGHHRQTNDGYVQTVT